MIRPLYSLAERAGNVHQQLVERSELAAIRTEVARDSLGINSPGEIITGRVCKFGAQILGVLFNLQNAEEIRRSFDISFAEQYVQALTDGASRTRSVQ